MKKKPFRSALAAAVLLSLGACQSSEDNAVARADSSKMEPQIAPILATADGHDVHSFARPLEARVYHVSLELNVDLDKRRIGGTATLDLDRKPEAKEIVLDDKGLEIESIGDGAGKPLVWKVGPADPNLGSPLVVALRPDTERLVIKYMSAPDAAALQWLGPEQTAGKRKPYLFSQGQSIENRSWIPTQDSPGIRQSWDATVHVPAGLIAVMSAPRSAEPITQGGESVFSFRMPHSVAPYMIAIGVGDLASRPLGPRTGVWTEPMMLDAAAAELSDTEKMTAAAERLFGPYQWGRYDMLVLPPSFPFGGMENPTMTFLTPTFIAGDKSLVSLVAHELAHSWSGNLATNATWADFWLNEGMTTYAERRIVEELYGPERAAQQVALGVDALRKQINDLGGPSSPNTRLHLDLKGRHPDEGSNEIAYEKGAAFLRTIEAIVGRARFDEWLKGWFQRNLFRPVTSAIFLADIRANLVNGDKQLEKKLMLDDWVYANGIPRNMVQPDSAAFADVDQAVHRFARSREFVPADQWRAWNTDERLRFLNKIPRKLSKERLVQLDRVLGLSKSRNYEISYAWLDLAVGNRFDPAIPAMQHFLTVQGRRKFVKPLIEKLAEDQGWGRPLATRIYKVARGTYHPITQRDIDKLKLVN